MEATAADMRSRLTRLGLLLALTAVLGFVFALAISAQRTARMHAALGMGIEGARPGAEVWDHAFDGTDGDDGEDGDEAFPPATPNPIAVPMRDRTHVHFRRIVERAPQPPMLAMAEDPP
ncbi:hypothetical protein BH09MYX1_BH09MYX1_16650 [soil metagenome]